MRVGAVNTLANRNKKDDKGQVNRGTETHSEICYI